MSPPWCTTRIEEYIYLELLWGESIDQMLQTGFQLLLLGDLAAVVLMVAVLAFLLMRINRTINDPHPGAGGKHPAAGGGRL